jgi:hypothetical protein
MLHFEYGPAGYRVYAVTESERSVGRASHKKAGDCLLAIECDQTPQAAGIPRGGTLGKLTFNCGQPAASRLIVSASWRSIHMTLTISLYKSINVEL